MRICFFGDSFTHGVGDETGRGWCGRVIPPGVTAYVLGIRRDTSADILRRWPAEARARLPEGAPARLCFAFGSNDAADDGQGAPRLSAAETRANAQRILSAAIARAPCLMIGPAPILDDPAADERIRAREPLLQAVARDLGVPFLPVMADLGHSAVWRESAGAGDGTHPGAAGYALLAERIRGWPPFQAWLG